MPLSIERQLATTEVSLPRRATFDSVSRRRRHGRRRERRGTRSPLVDRQDMPGVTLVVVDEGAAQLELAEIRLAALRTWRDGHQLLIIRQRLIPRVVAAPGANECRAGTSRAHRSDRWPDPGEPAGDECGRRRRSDAVRLRQQGATDNGQFVQVAAAGPGPAVAARMTAHHEHLWIVALNDNGARLKAPSARHRNRLRRRM